MRNFIVILSITMVVGCVSAPDKKTVENTVSPATDTGNAIKPANVATANIAGCYMQILKRDTFAASLQQTGAMVTGRMSFDNYEKDASSGTVSGKIEGDVLKLNYVFASEGLTSVMELYFKYSNGLLVRGTGEMRNKGDTAYFVNPALVKYDGGDFKRLSSEEMPVKYK